jgi:myotubularin-related protein 1/2
MKVSRIFNPTKLVYRTRSKDFFPVDGCFIMSHWNLAFYSSDGKLDLEETYNSVFKYTRYRRWNANVFDIEFKDMKLWILLISTDNVANDLENALAEYVSLREPVNKFIIDNSFAFQYRLPFDTAEDGWNVYNQQEDIDRMFKPLDKSKLMWTVTDANINYKICSSYPRLLALPTGFDLSLLGEAASYRDGGRLPVLSWIHFNNYATITRCSQPLPGRLGNKRCEADEALIKGIFEANPSMSISSNKILDARPFSNAMANRARGAGFEKTDLYCNVAIEWLDIENIHQMRESLDKLRILCLSVNTNETQWFSKLEGTGWLNHVSSVLKGAIKLALYIHKGHSVVLHCSHGWDRTAQLSSLAQLLLDPHYRTIRGFEQLIEKEWISFGHRIQDRAAHLTYLDPEASQALKEEESPIFLQFIDSVFQLLQQFPMEFGFTEEFLRIIMEHFYSCKFGTFLANSEKETLDLKLREKTISLWSWTNHPQTIKRFENPLFMFARHRTGPNTFLHATSSLDHMIFWTEFYHGPERVKCDKNSHNVAMCKVVWDLTQQIENMKKEIEQLKESKNHTDGNGMQEKKIDS